MEYKWRGAYTLGTPHKLLRGDIIEPWQVFDEDMGEEARGQSSKASGSLGEMTKMAIDNYLLRDTWGEG